MSRKKTAIVVFMEIKKGYRGAGRAGGLLKTKKPEQPKLNGP